MCRMAWNVEKPVERSTVHLFSAARYRRCRFIVPNDIASDGPFKAAKVTFLFTFPNRLTGDHCTSFEAVREIMLGRFAVDFLDVPFSAALFMSTVTFALLFLFSFFQGRGVGITS